MIVNPNEKVGKVAGLIVLLIGFVFSLIAFGFNMHDVKIRENWILNKGIVFDIDEYDEKITVTYEYNGVEYKVVPSFYSSEFDLADEIDIYMNPDNLEDIYLTDTSELFIAFYIVGGVFVLIGIALVILSKHTDKTLAYILENGTRRTLKVVEFKKTYITKGYQVYYVIKVLYHEKEYKSQPFRVTKDFDFNNLGIIDMYILENGKYYIDLKTYREGEILEF